MSVPAHGNDGASRPLELLSVVAPVYNEEATIAEFYSRVCSALEGLPFELVLVVFLHLPVPQRRAVLNRAAGMLSPGGTVLILGHDTTNLTDGYGGPQDPSILFTPQDVVADLYSAAGIRIQFADRVLRRTEGRDAIDALVVATKVVPDLEEQAAAG